MFLSFFLSNDSSGVQAFDWRATNLSQATWGIGADAANPVVIPFGTTGTFEAATSGSVTGSFFYNPDPEDPDLPPLVPTISENTGSVLAGNVVGFVTVPADPEDRTEALTFSFYIEADPLLSDSDRMRCEVVE